MIVHRSSVVDSPRRDIAFPSSDADDDVVVVGSPRANFSNVLYDTALVCNVARCIHVRFLKNSQLTLPRLVRSLATNVTSGA